MDRATKEQGTLLDSGLLIIRLFTGFLMFYLHGWSKLIAGPERWQKLGTALTDVFGLDFLALPFGFLASFSESRPRGSPSYTSWTVPAACVERR